MTDPDQDQGPGYRGPFTEDDQGLAQVQAYQPPADLREALTRGLPPGVEVDLTPLEQAGLIPTQQRPAEGWPSLAKQDPEAEGWPGGGEQ
jgi:hypothetical protein